LKWRQSSAVSTTYSSTVVLVLVGAVLGLDVSKLQRFWPKYSMTQTVVMRVWQQWDFCLGIT